MKKNLDLTVQANKQLNDSFAILTLKASEPLPQINPGQFVEIKVDNAPQVYLRRPFSINNVDRQANTIDVLVQIMGNGSAILYSTPVGEVLSVIFPLGNSFSMPTSKSDPVLLVAGGCGAAPLLFFGEKLKQQGYAPHFLVGARREDLLLFSKEYAELGPLYTCTQDGSHGHKGLVTEHPILADTSVSFKRIYSCGPDAMMKAVARVASSKGVDCEVSLENTMACGIGACLCCVVDTTSGHQCVCTKGPVFNIKDLKW